MELVDTQHVSEFTKKTLAQFGWKEGDAIPAELGAFLVKIRESLPASPRSDVLVDAAVMPPEAIEEAKALLVQAKGAAAERDKRQAVEDSLANLNPAARALYQATVEDAAPQIIDDRETESLPTPPEPPADQTAQPAPEPEQADSTGATPMLILPFCPRCGWDMRQKFDVVPTDLDKEDFVAAVLGNTRFKRDYKLMGGKMLIAFKTILAEENKMIHRQLVRDQEAKKIVTEAEWFVQMMEYRMALSLDYITNGAGKPTAMVPSLETFPAGKDESQLVALTDHVNNTHLAHEVTRRLVGTHLRQFQRLVEALEAMALEPSFWNGID